MKYSNKSIEKYILQDYKPKEDHSVEEGILSSGHSNCKIAIVIWIVLHIVSTTHSTPISVWPANIAIVLLIYPVALLAIKKCKSDFETFMNKPENRPNPNQPKNRSNRNKSKNRSNHNKSKNRSNYNKSKNKPSPNKKKGYFASMTTTGGVMLGGAFASSVLPRFSDKANMIVLSMLLTLSILVLIHVACKEYYKVHLIRKYCPYLKETDGIKKPKGKHRSKK